MIIFITLSNGVRIHSLNSFVIKTTKILYDLSLYYVKQMCMVVRLISNRSQRRQNVSDTLGYSQVCATFLLLPHFVICY